MKVTSKISSEQIKTQLIEIADGVVAQRIGASEASAAVGAYRTLFQLLSIELRAAKSEAKAKSKKGRR